jgi:hypothetical protein
MLGNVLSIMAHTTVVGATILTICHVTIVNITSIITEIDCIVCHKYSGCSSSLVRVKYAVWKCLGCLGAGPGALQRLIGPYIFERHKLLNKLSTEATVSVRICYVT